MTIEEIVFEHLTPRLSVPVYTEVPPEPPRSFVSFEKTGGRMEEHIKYAAVAVQSCAPSRYEAMQLNEQVKEKMLTLDERDDICRVELNNDYHFSDPESKKRRYQAVFDITFY